MPRWSALKPYTPRASERDDAREVGLLVRHPAHDGALARRVLLVVAQRGELASGERQREERGDRLHAGWRIGTGSPGTG